MMIFFYSSVYDQYHQPPSASSMADGCILNYYGRLLWRLGLIWPLLDTLASATYH